MSFWEVIGFLTGILGVWLTAKGNILCWPVSIINVSIYVILFYEVKLYGDMGLQVFYIVMSVIGWINWNKKKEDPFQTSVLSFRPMALLLALSIVAFVTLLIILNKLNASVPEVDALTTTLSLLATWLTIKKKVESWIIWILADTIYVLMYLYKSLYLTATLYLVFTILAILGYYEWKKKLKYEESLL